jgi:hypothetical protein
MSNDKEAQLFSGIGGEWQPITLDEIRDKQKSVDFGDWEVNRTKCQSVEDAGKATGELQVLTMQYESKTKNPDLSVTYENCQPVEWQVIRPPKSWAVRSLMFMSKTLYSASEMVDRIMMRII